MAKSIAFIAWSQSTRSKILAQYFNAKTIQCRISDNHIVRLFNYPFLMFITFLNLVYTRFDVVFVQLPPIQAAIPAYLYCKIFRKKLIFDSHSGIFFFKGLHQKIYFKYYCSIVKNININIVHNENILMRQCIRNTPSIMLEDKIYFSPTPLNKTLPIKIAVICGYGKDEPICEIIETARILSEVQFFLTGNSSKFKVNQKSQNISFTGYLSDIGFEKLLRTVNIIIVLSNRADTVLCGAYEAVGLTKPLITSDTPTLRKYFGKGAIHTANNTQAIIQAIQTAQGKLNQLYNEMVELRKEKTETWQNQFEPLQRILDDK